MFGFGFLKLLVLAAIVAAVWYGFKWLQRRDEIAARGGDESLTKTRGNKRVDAVEDMVKCPVCGTYVAAEGAQDCGKPDCPY